MVPAGIKTLSPPINIYIYIERERGLINYYLLWAMKHEQNLHYKLHKINLTISISFSTRGILPKIKNSKTQNY